MSRWQIRSVVAQAAANEPWPVFMRRRDVTVGRVGDYTRVVLTRRSAPLA